jgi:eukaryotic-like serine/threonine-protein kinase
MSERRLHVEIAAPSRPTRWLAGGPLPSEMGEDAAHRLGSLALVMMIMMALFSALYGPLNTESRQLLHARHVIFIPFVATFTSFVASIVILVLSRRKTTSRRLLESLRPAYQILIAFDVGLLHNLVRWGSESNLAEWSGVGVWILIFSVLVPTSPARTLVAGLASAAMDPLALLVTVACGSPLPGAFTFLASTLPTLLALLVAVVASRINFRLARRIDEARQLGAYRMVEPLGKGGMGEVWRAEHTSLARPAAIKIIRTDSMKGASPEEARRTLQRFEQEAQATARLESPHTIQVYDYGRSTEGDFYYVMELLDGLDLEQLIQRFGPVPPERAVHLLLQACDSLSEAHGRGMIHRDIKPANIYTCKKAFRYDVVKVLDFGLVKTMPASALRPLGLTVEDQLIGTPSYMVPEVIKDPRVLDGRADLYALGCVGYFLLSGHLVFEGDTSLKLILAHAGEPPPPLVDRVPAGFPPGLAKAIHDCLEKDPDRRPQSATELKERLVALGLAETWTQARARDWWLAHLETAPSAPPIPNVDPLGPTIGS